MADRSHLNALQTRLSHERGYLTAAQTESERELRRVWIAQIEREISAECAFLGIADVLTDDVSQMSEAELLAELMA